MLIFLKKLTSFLFPVIVKKYYSRVNGNLTVAFENGKQVLNSAHANYSFGELHAVFKSAFDKIDLTRFRKILLLGLGAGSVVKLISKKNKTAIIHAVESDSVVVEIAKKDFHIDHYKNLEIYISDALNFLNTGNTIYDLIVTDIFIDDKVPDFIFSDAFFKSLKIHCNEYSLVIVNAALPGKQSKPDLNKIACSFFLSVKKKHIRGNEVYFIKHPL